MMPNYISHKILSIFKIHEEPNNKRQLRQLKNGKKTWVNSFLKIYKWLTKLVKQGSASLIIREIIKTTMRYHFTPTRIAAAVAVAVVVEEIVGGTDRNKCW